MKTLFLRWLLPAVCAGSSLAAQDRHPATARGVPPGYAPLAAVSSDTGVLATRITLKVSQRPLGNILTEIARLSGLSLAADPSLPGMAIVRDLTIANVGAREAILRVLEGTALHALVGPAGQIVIARRLPAAADSDSVSPLMRARLSGYVRDAETGELVRRAQISTDNDVFRMESSEEGFYSLLLAVGTHRVHVRAMGYAPFDTTVTLVENAKQNVLMLPRTFALAAVNVHANANKEDRPDLDPMTPDMSVVRLNLAAVKLLPVVLGEPDPIRSLTLLPGVSLSSDASTAFSVRGGGGDQNLILLDEATIYNPSHVLGFFSTFNADAVDDVTLYKGAIPAKFGGRLSSVVDVRQREGNAHQFTGTAAIGLLASRVLLEGPLLGKRGSYMLAARRTYADLFLRASSDTTLNQVDAYFYDVNAKTNLRLGKSGAVLLSGYLGRDRFGDSRTLNANWGNRAVTLRWNQAIQGQLFSKFTTAWGEYDYLIDMPIDKNEAVLWRSRTGSLDIKLDETWYLSEKNTIEFGVQYSDQRIRPGALQRRGVELPLQQRDVSSRNGSSPSAYLGQDLKLGERFAVRYGVRWAGFARQGPGKIYRYQDDAPVVYNQALRRYESGVVIDSTAYSSRKTVVSYSGFEPRISGRMMLTDAASVKLSYARTQQFLLLASKTNSITPIDVWEPAGPYVKPQFADQFALGYSRSSHGYELSVETYYKLAHNIVDFIDGAEMYFNPRIESLLVQGVGRSYGMETHIRRNTGTVTGWISYTLSRAEQRFRPGSLSGAAAGEGINGGRYFTGPFDKTHNLSVVALRPVGRKWTAGTTFMLASGLPATYPTARYMVDGLLVTEFGPRNSARLPMYHRLDVSATRAFARSELQFGVLNAYNRFNAQTMNFRQKVGNPVATEAVQTSIFGIVPSINYIFHF